MSDTNCVRCAACQTNSLTDFTESKPFITCGVVGKGRTIKLEPCPIAPRKTRYASKVELGWLRANNRNLPIEEVMRITGRSCRSSLRNLCTKNGIPSRVGTEGAYRNISKAQRRRSSWTGGQDEYILSLPEEKWPYKGGDRAQNTRQRKAIANAVGRRGPRHTWKQISERRYVLSPAGQRHAEQIRRLKREKNRARKKR